MNESVFSDIDPSEEKAYRIAWLVAGFLRHTLSDAEQIELDDWVTANMRNQRLFEKLIDEKNLHEWVTQKQNTNTEAALLKLKQKIEFAPVPKTFSGSWMYIAAAVVLTGIIVTILLFNKNKTSIQATGELPVATDIPPGEYKAMLILADGKKIVLDTSATDRLATEKGLHIEKSGGQLSYEPAASGTAQHASFYNTLVIPAGGQYKLLLPDGTMVWLNASSSLKYPVVFGAGKRAVELTGEAYFEVAKNTALPFEVYAGGDTVTVTGTHFNVNAYADEPALKVVLAEGAVKINTAVTLAAGEQAIVEKNGNIKKDKTDLQSALAWKNGQFLFKEAALGEIMRQVARWYDAEIDNKTFNDYHFNADIPRNVPVSKLLHLLEATRAVHFNINGKKITVLK